ncbi:MAG: Ku protein [Geminicoccaceae bacterium]|nr:Ku protein [Geminicoccaceae bacterium]
MAAPRAYWSGNLRLSLVSIPVQLYAATRSAARPTLNQIHRPTGKRIRYQKVAPGEGAVESDDIVKGYEYEKGSYVLLSDEELDALRLSSRNTIDLVQFVEHCEIDPLYFERPYYLTPRGEDAEEGFRVIRDALRQMSKVALGQLTMRGREHLVAVKPCGNGLLVETLRYEAEVRQADTVFDDIGGASAPGEMLDLAKELIERKSAPFDAGRFKDHYAQALRELVQAKVKSEGGVAVDESGGPDYGGKVVDLMEALKKSVAGSGTRKASGKAGGTSGSAGRKASSKAASGRRKSA